MLEHFGAKHRIERTVGFGNGDNVGNDINATRIPNSSLNSLFVTRTIILTEILAYILEMVTVLSVALLSGTGVWS